MIADVSPSVFSRYRRLEQSMEEDGLTDEQVRCLLFVLVRQKKVELGFPFFVTFPAKLRLIHD